MQGMIQHSLLGGLGWQLPASKLLEVRSGTDAKITEATQQRILTVCDPTAEWVWTGAKVPESIPATWDGTWRKRAADEKCGDIRFMETEMLAVGPILFPSKATSYAFQWEGLLPEDWRADISAAIGQKLDQHFSEMCPTSKGHPCGHLAPFLGDNLPAEINQYFVSFDNIWPNQIGTGSRVFANVMTPEWVQQNIDAINRVAGAPFTGTYEEFIRTGLWSSDLIDAFVAPRPDNPVFLAKHPINGKDYGIFMSLVRRDLTKEWDSTTNPFVLQFVWRPVDKSWWTKAWEFIKRIVVKVVNFGKDIFCSLTNSQVATGMAMSSGNAYAMAGAAGAQVLAPLLCQPKTQVCWDGSTIDINAMCPLQPEKKSGIVWPWVVGGVAVAGLVAFLLAKPKPKKKQLPAGT
jgi:hypothetical protein